MQAIRTIARFAVADVGSLKTTNPNQTPAIGDRRKIQQPQEAG
jgi:hypothetical protein